MSPYEVPVEFKERRPVTIIAYDFKISTSASGHQSNKEKGKVE